MPRVLVVNDEPDLVDICALVLARAGYQVHTVINAKRVIAEAMALRPDVVIVDWVLATCDARDVLLDLRVEPSTSKIPVVLISALPTASQRAKLYAFDGFLPKPFSAPALLAAVDAALSKRATASFSDASSS
jgi:DNA-binding response OmpR family regulator